MDTIPPGTVIRDVPIPDELGSELTTPTAIGQFGTTQLPLTLGDHSLGTWRVIGIRGGYDPTTHRYGARVDLEQVER